MAVSLTDMALCPWGHGPPIVSLKKTRETTHTLNPLKFLLKSLFIWLFINVLSASADFCLLGILQVKVEVCSIMEGLYFEVKSRKGEEERISDNRHPNLTSCSAISRRSSSSLLYCKLSSMRRRMEAISQENEEEEDEENDAVEVRYKLILTGSLSVHYLTTMAMLPWVVAEISKAQDSEKKPTERGPHPQIVFLCVSVSWVRCVSILGEELLWDPLTHTLLFECLPHQVTKLIHNSQEPSSFGCLVRDSANCACYVFRCQDSSKVSVCACGFVHNPALHKKVPNKWNQFSGRKLPKSISTKVAFVSL